LGHGEWLRLLRANGFEVLHYTYVPAAWARQWPAEEIWVAQKRAPEARPR
jgi:hypothetical protein